MKMPRERRSDGVGKETRARGLFGCRAHDLASMVTMLVLCLMAQACSTRLSGRREAGSSFPLPDWGRLKQAAMHAATDPITLSSAAASAVCYLGGIDPDISKWAREENHLFGSPGRARDCSDGLRDAAIYSCYAGMCAEAALGLAKEGPRGLLLPGLSHAGVGAAAIGINSGLTSWIKDASGRLRPDGSDRRSFPSGHSSEAAVAATLAAHSAQRLNVSGWWGTGFRAGMGLTAATAAWARVEGGRHYPSDVLAGAALGRFLGNFASSLFLGYGDGSRLQVVFFPARDGIRAAVWMELYP